MQAAEFLSGISTSAHLTLQTYVNMVKIWVLVLPKGVISAFQAFADNSFVM